LHDYGYWTNSDAWHYVREFERYLEERWRRRKEGVKKLRELMKVREVF